MSITIYHNPRCSKSRATLALLNNQGCSPKIIEYLQNPPTVNTLRTVLQSLGMAPRQLLRKGQAEYKEQGLDDPSLSDDQVIMAMVNTPILIERPIVVTNGKAAIGRPPEAVLEIL